VKKPNKKNEMDKDLSITAGSSEARERQGGGDCPGPPPGRVPRTNPATSYPSR